jgi:hypothetical protein
MGVRILTHDCVGQRLAREAGFDAVDARPANGEVFVRYSARRDTTRWASVPRQRKWAVVYRVGEICDVLSWHSTPQRAVAAAASHGDSNV